MSSPSYRRRLKRLERRGEPDIVKIWLDAVIANGERWDRQFEAYKALAAFAQDLVGPLDPRPEPTLPDPADEFPELRPRPMPPSQAREVWHDPRHGGAILTRFGGLGSSADAIRVMPPPEPAPDTRPRKPRPNPWGLVIPDRASAETKAWARSMGWLPFDERPIEDEEED